MGNRTTKNCRLLIVGGGTGGLAVAAKLSGKIKEIIILEPNEKHYYQPYFTLIGGGMKCLKDSWQFQKDIIPKNCKWRKGKVLQFVPEKNQVITDRGDSIKYDFMVVAVGLKCRYDKIPGLKEALEMPEEVSMVCSNYSPKYVERTFICLCCFKKGDLVFTLPNTPICCSGAPQKCMYIADDFLRKTGERKKANLIYNTAQDVIFVVPKYADALWKVVEKKNLTVNLKSNLIEVDPCKKLAVFQNLDRPKQRTTYNYSFLHVTPPMEVPECLKKNKDLTSPQGFLHVNNNSMQHKKYKNIFGIGDCCSSPNPKTAAACSSQSSVVAKNLLSVMGGKEPTAVYNGYTSCPLVTSYNTCIMAEFDGYKLKPYETLLINQAKERYSMFLVKKHLLPWVYWNGLVRKGWWDGPTKYRKFLNPFGL